jgi:hypothetical protein
VIDGTELRRRFRSDAAAPLERAQNIGVLRELGDGRYEEVTPQALRGGEMLAEFGIPVDEALDVAAVLSFFQMSMREAAESRIGAELQRMAQRRRRGNGHAR